MARCDSEITTTPEIPQGANLWNTVSTIVAPAARAAFASVRFTHSRSSRCSVSHSYKSSTTWDPHAGCSLDSPSPGIIFSSPARFLRSFSPFCLFPLLFLSLLLAWRPTGLDALHRLHDLRQRLVREAVQGSQTRPQQLALLHGDPEPDASLLEHADELVVGGGHGEAVANHLVEHDVCTPQAP